jgi:hypothetical protein
MRADSGVWCHPWAPLGRSTSRVKRAPHFSRILVLLVEPSNSHKPPSMQVFPWTLCCSNRVTTLRTFFHSVHSCPPDIYSIWSFLEAATNMTLTSWPIQFSASLISPPVEFATVPCTYQLIFG